MILNVILGGLSLAAFYFILASGLSLVFGIMEVLNFASAGFFLCGLYAAWYALSRHLSLALALLIAAAVGALLALIVERLLLRPLYRSPAGQLLTTLGVMLVLGAIVEWVFGPQIQQENLTGAIAGTVVVAGSPFPTYRLLLIVLGIAVYLLISLLLRGTPLGLRVRAGVENRTLVELAGIRLSPLLAFVYALGGALAALAGALYGPFGGVYPTAGVDTLLITFIVVVVGGLGSITGTLVASLLVGLSQALVGFFAPSLALTVNVLLMLLVLALRPQGMFGRPPGRRDTHAV